MLFFRSEEAIDLWCDSRRLERGPTATLPQLWLLARAWYSDRLTPGAQRPQPEEIRRILDGAGLTDPVWDPRADAF